MKYKFLYNGIKDMETGEFYKCHYSKGDIFIDGKIDDEVMSIYAADYGGLPRIDGVKIENDSDIMTDYFEGDIARVFPNHEIYNDLLKAWEQQEIHDIKRLIKYNKKYMEKCHNPITVEILKKETVRLEEKLQRLEAK